MSDTKKPGAVTDSTIARIAGNIFSVYAATESLEGAVRMSVLAARAIAAEVERTAGEEGGTRR